MEKKVIMNKASKYPLKSEANDLIKKSLYLINDQYNTFEHVIDCLVVICELKPLQAEQCTLITHYNGICEIASGSFEELSDLQEDLSIYGLNVEII